MLLFDKKMNMKNIIYLSLLFIGILYSCGNSNGPIEDDPDTDLVENFKIHGKIEGASNSKIYLEALSNEGTIPVADCQTDSEGTFEMLGNVPGMGIYQLRLGEGEDKIIPVTLLPKDNLELQTTYSDYQTTPKFTGTEWGKTLSTYMEMFNTFAAEQQKLATLQGQVSEEELMKKFYALKKPLDDFCLQSMSKKPDNPANIILSSSLTPSMGFKDWNPENLVVLKKVAAAFTKRYKDSPIAATISNQMFQLESAYNEFLEFNSGNKLAPEIALKNPDGKEIRLSSLKGKVVLIDFWASWCAPCRKEMPNVVKLYNQYKSKGFTIYSVSLDKDIKAWKEAITKDGMSWPNHVSDLMGWESQMPKLYGFQGIPYTVLIDKEGKIMGTGLRGESLEQKLNEIFKN
ncbi:MAG: TlpA family protein disulfide reductase [Flavobacteriia bacterium]|nr:TlpA family protein disulfide reductase [Flavobacteriia bacterium]